MIAKIAYIISILISYVPKFIITMKYNNSLSKEGYRYCSNSLFYIDQMKMVLGASILSIIPGINIISGIRTIGKLSDYKESYDEHKSDLLSIEMIELDEKITLKKLFEDIKEFEKKPPVPIDFDALEREDPKLAEILRLSFELDEMGCDIDDDFNNKLTNEERLEYYKRLKEEALEKEKELKLTKK